MPKSMTVRNIDDEVYARLRQRAARHGRSAEAEVRDILTRAAAAEPSSDFWEEAAKLRDSIKGGHHTPAEVLIREDRDER